MRGMGHGYTQILINGERVPPGFSIDELVPDQVERIEIYRAPTAETGARAIAGTINIVLREALRTHINEIRLQLSDEVGAWRIQRLVGAQRCAGRQGYLQRHAVGGAKQFSDRDQHATGFSRTPRPAHRFSTRKARPIKATGAITCTSRRGCNTRSSLENS